jgi:S-adenosylmethionine synthetase
MQEYYEIKAKVAEEIKQNLKSITKKQVDDIVNTLDASNGKSIDDVYLTVTGLSAEMGDDGQVGRGNRASGLITPCRPMSLEAPCGKNPISHTGKIYNVLAQQIANDIIKQNAAKECYVKILSQIGKPIDNPFVCSVQVDDLSREKEAMQIVDNWLANITNITELIINEKVRLY